MTLTVEQRREKFRIGRVFGGTFSVIGRNLWLCLGLAVLLVVLPTLLFQFLIAKGMLGTPRLAGGQAALPLVFGIVSYLFAQLLKASLVRATIQDLDNKRPSFGDCIGTALRLFLPVIGITILVTLGAILGMILLIVPGVILFLNWSVSVPALVQERLGVIGSMKRSRALTKGSRWRLLGLFLVILIVAYALQLALGLSLSLFHPYVFLALLTLMSTLTSLIGSVAAAVAYVELRLVKEGTSIGDLAEIFA